jgi:DNA-binding NarL/FixJ family response regulator
MIKILLADEQQVVREGLHALLESNPDFTVVGEAANGLEAIKKTETLEPDVLILDIAISGMDGFDITRQALKNCRKTKVLVLSMYNSEACVLSALRAGAKGYLLKNCGFKELAEAVHKVHEGTHYLSAPFSERAMEVYTQMANGGQVDPYDSLTTREREILHLAAEGYTTAEIASRLFVSRRTVEAHRANMMRKLGLHNQTQVVRYAMQMRMLDKEPEQTHPQSDFSMASSRLAFALRS